MFSFFKKKSKKELESIRNFNEAIKTIKFFIATLEWEKAKKAIEEIKQKELKAYKEIIEDIEWDDKNPEIQKEKEKISKEFSKKQKQLDKLANELEEKKTKYEEKIKKQEFDIKLKLLKKEIDNLSNTWNINQALNLIKDFIKENEANPIAIKYYNKQKAKLEKLLQKQKEAEEKKLEKDIKLEALKLIWENVNIKEEEKDENNKRKNIFSSIIEKINFYKKIKEKIKEKQMIKEIEILLKEEKALKSKINSSKLENIHKWLIKEINEDILGYDLYGKILWANKISGDTFGFYEGKNKYDFFIWDATGHWVKAWLIITLLTRLFNKYVWKKDLQELVLEINNWLKQDLKSMNFITSIFAEINKKDLKTIKFVGLWHEPMLIYRKKTKEVEKVIPGWIAAWIRIIKDKNNIKVKKITLEDWDILLTYSDWLLEAKSQKWEYYWIDRLINIFKKVSSAEDNMSINSVYAYILKDVSDFRGWTAFDDDLTILLLKRNAQKDIVDDTTEILKEIEIDNVVLEKNDLKKLKWKTKKEIKAEIEKIKKQKETEVIIKKLKQLWLSWEILTLKEEAKRYIKKWYIHPKINYYLKKAFENQRKYKIKLKEERLKNKYTTLKELLKKWDYDTVIKEAQDIILKDWNL